MRGNQERQGELFVFLQAVLWGLFPVITILSYGKLSPVVSLALSTFFSALFFGVVLSLKKKWHELTNISALKNALLTTIFLGILFYLFYFFGLQHTSAGNASIVALTEIFFSYLFFNVWKKDRLPFFHLLGAILMILGAVIVLFPNVHSFHLGDLLVLCAVTFPPFGNYFARKAREEISSEAIMFIRSSVSCVVIFLLAIALKNTFAYSAIRDSLLFLLIDGVLLLGVTKLLWIEGIHRISVVKANAINSTSPLMTLLFAWLLLKTPPTPWQLLAFIPMFFGIVLLGKGRK